MKKVAVIGLGIMGHGIADNFLKKGYEVYVWNRHPDKAQDLKGAKLAGSPKEATEQADIIFEVTANDESSREVWMGKQGILGGAKPGQYLITCATLSVNWVEELAAKCKEQSLTFFDMPMTGSRMGAENGQLILLAGGDRSKLEMIKEDLEHSIAKEVKYFGAVGSGTKYKLILNTLQGIHLLGFGEALRMAKETGLEVKTVGDALAEAPGGTATNLAWKNYQNEPKPINFSVEWETKDLTYAQEMAKKSQYPLRDKAQDKFKRAVEEGHGDEDWTTVIKPI